MSKNLTTYDPVRYPIVIQVLNGKVIAAQPDLQIYRVRGKFADIRKREEIGAIVLDVIEEVIKTLQSTSEPPPPSQPTQALKDFNPCSAPPVKPRRYLRMEYAAEALGVHVMTVYRMCDRGELDFHTTPGGQRRILLNERNMKVLNAASAS